MAKKESLVKKVLEKKTLYFCFALLVPCLFIRFGKMLNHLIGTITWNVFCLFYYYPFVILVLALLLKFLNKVELKFLKQVGIYSYSIYLVHGYTYEMVTNADLTGVVFFFFLTILLSIVFEFIIRWLKAKIAIYIC